LEPAFYQNVLSVATVISKIIDPPIPMASVNFYSITLQSAVALNGNANICNSTDRLLVIGSGAAAVTTAFLVEAEIHQIPTTIVYAGSKPFVYNYFWA